MGICEKMEMHSEEISLTCHADLSGPSQVEVWETSWVERVDLRAVGIRLHPTALLKVEETDGRVRNEDEFVWLHPL